jgi:drug/metabolite transporter (DMT)-like permease
MTPSTHSNHHLRGIFLVLAAVFVFASMDTTSKFLVTRYAVPLVMTARYVVNLILVVAVFAPSNGRALFAINRKGLVWLRAFSLAFASLFAGLALKAMPVAETVAIIYLAPFGVLLLSGPMLGEKVRLAGWLATALGFVGLLFIVRPGGGLALTGIMFALLCAAVTVIYHSLSRLLAKTETTASTQHLQVPFSSAPCCRGTGRCQHQTRAMLCFSWRWVRSPCWATSCSLRLIVKRQRRCSRPSTICISHGQRFWVGLCLITSQTF